MKLELEIYNLDKDKNTILFLPAFPVPKEMYRPQIEFLKSKGIPFIALNYPGVGKSDKPSKIEANVSDLVGVIWDNINDLSFNKIIPIGTSMGGYVMFELWRQHRDRIAGMIFCHTRPEALDEEGKKKRLSDIDKINENIEEYLKSFSKNLLSDYTIENRKEVVNFVEEIENQMTKEGLSYLVYVIATRPDSRGLLKEINVPCLLVAGKNDKIVPLDIMRGMAQELLNSTLVELDNVGHMSSLETPEIFNNILISFLEDKDLI